MIEAKKHVFVGIFGLLFWFGSFVSGQAQIPQVDKVLRDARVDPRMIILEAQSQLRNAQEKFKHGNFQQTAYLTRLALRNVPYQLEPIVYAELLDQLARAEYRLGDTEAAILHAKRAVQIFQRKKYLFHGCSALATLGAALNTAGRSREARQYLLSALKYRVYLKKKDPAILERLYVNLAHGYISENNDQPAKKYLEKAIQLGSNTFQPSSVAYHNLSDVYSRQGNMDKSLSCEIQALKIAENNRDTFAISLSYLSLADFSIRRRDTIQAKLYLNRIQRLWKQGKVSTLTYRNMMGLYGIHFFYNNQFNNSKQYLLAALHSPVPITSDYATFLYLNIAASYLNLHQADSARWFAKQLAPLIQRTPDQSRMAEYCLLISDLEQFSGNNAKALHFLQKTLLIAEQKKLKLIKLNALDKLNLLAKSFSPARKILEKYAENMPKLLDSIGSDYATAGNRFAVYLANIKKDKELAQQRIHAMEREQIAHQRLLWLLMVAFIAMTFLVATLWFRNRMLHTQREALMLERETLRRTEELRAFNYTVSHDLKAPLRNAIGFVELFKALYANQLDERGSQYIEQFYLQMEEMSGMIEGMRSYAEVEQTELQYYPIVTNELIEKLIEQFKSAEMNRHIVFEVQPDLPVLRGDPLMIRQVFTNLLSNAVKFTRQANPARISIKGRVEGRMAYLQVTDNGVGISPLGHYRLFQLFKSAHDRRQFEGSGAGLAIVKRIVERHGGHIKVESEEGKGATFELSLPCAAGRLYHSQSDDV